MTIGLIQLSPLDLAVAAAMVVALAGFSRLRSLGIERRLLIAGLRATVQLLLVGLVLDRLFAFKRWYFVSAMAAIMLAIAGWEVMSRQRRRLRGPWGYGVGASAMFVSSFSVTAFALLALLGTHPWYEPRYAIPLLGMLLGNTMNGVSLAVDRLNQYAWEQRAVIEQRLLLGETSREAIADYLRESLRQGMVPIMNAMAAAGVISLPGMMTGQILGGSPPVDAVKYQILILLLIAVGTAGGILFALKFSVHRLFDERHRLRLDRLAASSR